MHPAIILILLVLALLFVSWIKRAPPAVRSQLMKKALIGGGVALLLLAVLTGRLHWLYAVVGGAIPLVQRLLSAAQLYRWVKSMRGPSPGQTSSVETGFVRMTLNHDTGDMDGEVIRGRFSGSQLADLGLEELLVLYGECSGEDAQSSAVLEAYLDRRFGEKWRERTEGRDERHAGTRGNGSMTPEEARQILGVGPEASEREIVEAHRRLMQKVHPDRGGSPYLAAKLNQAKDLLLRA